MHAQAQSDEASDGVETAAPQARDRLQDASAWRVREQFNRFIRAVSWVAADALPRWKAKVAAIVLCNVIGLASAAAAIGGVMAYARAAETKVPMRLLGMHWNVGGDVRSLLLFGAIIAGLGCVSAVAMFLVDRMILNLAARYHALCSERALAIAADPLCRGWQAMDDEPPRVILSRLVSGTSRIMGLVLRNLLRAILPVLTVLASVAFLFYIDATLTLMLLPATLAYLLPLYLINRRVTRMQGTYRDLSPQARVDVSRRLRGLLDSGELEQGAAQVKTDALHSEASDGARAAFYGRLLADRRVHLLNMAFFIVCLVALLIFFGIRARERDQPWSDLIFYVLALRFAMTSVKQATSVGAKFSRFFHEFRTYATFVSDSERTRARRSAVIADHAPLPSSLTIRIGKSAQWDSPRTVRIDRPGVLLAVTPGALGFADLEAIGVRLEQRLVEDADITTRAAFVVQGEALSNADAAPVVFITARVAARPEAHSMMQASLYSEGTLIVIVSDDANELLAPPLINEHFNASVVVLDGSRVVAGGDIDWFTAHLDDITSFLRAQADTERGRGVDVDDDDDGDDA